MNPNSITDLFSSNPYSIIYESTETDEIRPLNPVTFSSPVEFYSPPLAKSMKNISDIHVYGKIQLLKHNGDLYKESDVIQPRLTNNILTSFFKAVKMSVNNVPVFSNDNCYMFRDIIESYFNHSPASVLSQMEIGGLYENDNKLKEVSKNSRIFDLYSKLNFINTEKLLIPSCSISIRLEFNSLDFIIIESESSDKKQTNSIIQIHELSLFIKRYNLRESYLFEIERQLTKTPAIYETRKTVLIHFLVPSKTTVLNLTNLYNSLRPDFAIVCFLSSKQFNGDRMTDSLVFKTYDIKSFSFLLNNKSFPKTPYTFNFSDKEKCYARALSDLYSAIQLRNKNESVLVSKDNYESRFFIACDFSSSEHALLNINSPLEFSLLGVNCVFNKAQEDSLIGLLYLLVPTKFQINSNRMVEVVY